MIKCKGCETELGTVDDFGFLVMDEKNGIQSSHFVLCKTLMVSVEKTFIVVNPELKKGKYYDADCTQCQFNLGKKFIGKYGEFSYIAFGKEKLLYDGVSVMKTDKWLPFLDSSPFKSMVRFEMKDFSTKGSNGRNSRGLNDSSRKGDNSNAAQWNRNARGLTPNLSQSNEKTLTSSVFTTDFEVDCRNSGTSSVNRNSRSISKDHSSRGPPAHFAKSSDNFQGKISAQERLKPPRNKIGSNLNDRLNFLKMKTDSWDAEKLIYEFTGPNKENWEEISGVTLESEMTGQLMCEVLKLLSNEDIRESPLANSLYIPLSNMRALQCYMMTGLSSSEVTVAVSKGRGGEKWIRAMDAALCVVETIASLMQKFVDCQSNPFVPVEQLVLRIETLLSKAFVSPQSEDEAATLDGWISNISESKKASFMIKAEHLSSRLCFIKRMQESALAAKLESALGKDEDEKEKAKDVRLANQRAQGGITFLNDPLRDRDYLITSVVPQSFELISNAPSSLPQNIVSSLSLNRSRSENDDSIGDVDFSKVQSSATKHSGNLSHPEYRNNDHYLNTHFQLVREDCLAQLRRGISNFREQLGADSKAGDIDVPKPEQVRKVATAMMQSRSGNSGVYFYDNVSVQSVERCSQQDIGYAVTFSLVGNRKIDWANTQRFMTGSLLCLSDGTFNESKLVVARVLRGVKTPNGNTRGWIPTVTIGIDKDSIHRFDPVLTYTMIESMVYFDASRPVLDALKKLGTNNDLPFSDVLLGRRQRGDAFPAYLLEPMKTKLGTGGRGYLTSALPQPTEKKGWDMTEVFPHFERVNGTKFWNPVSGDPFPSLPSDQPLNDSQKEAIKLALTNKFAVIQGPPGTGKTHTGVIIAKILLGNQHLRAKKPILFICQTNHALDQMLEHIYKFEENIIRVGGRSESVIMQALSIDNARKGTQSVRRTPEQYDALGRMSTSFLALKAAFAQRRVFSSNCNTSDASSMIFANCTLARLQSLLEFVQPGAGQCIEDLVFSSTSDVQRAAWESCRMEAVRRREGLSGWLDEDLQTGFDEWLHMSAFDRLLLMATFAPDCSSVDVTVHIADRWRLTAVKKKKKKLINADEWQVMGKKQQVVDDDSDCEDDKLDWVPVKAPYTTLDDNDMTELEEAEAALEKMNRDLDDDDDDYFLRSHISSRPQKDIDIVKNLVKRKVNISIPSALKSKLLDYAWSDLSTLSKRERSELANCWSELLGLDAAADVGKYTKSYRSAAAIDEGYKASLDSTVLRSAAAIGMTTNGAAKYNTMIRILQPEVIIVEEAAEVLEASIVASFTTSTKHVILIGDHLQLRPQVSEFSIGVHNGLEVSLFERLIHQGHRYVTLTTQWRMHPDICALITPNIYKTLENAPSVSLYPPVSGVRDRLFFISHTQPEDGSDSTWGGDKSASGTKMRGSGPLDMVGTERSKTNSHEVIL